MRAAKERRALGRTDRPDETHTVAVDPRPHELIEVRLVLHDASKDEGHTAALGHIDRLHRSLVGMDPAEEEQVPTRRRMQYERTRIDPVMDRRDVVERRVPVGVADRDVGSGHVVTLIHGEDPRRREAVNRRQDGRLDEAAISKWQEVEAVVDDVELGGSLEHVRDMEAFAHLGLDVRILRVPPRNDRREPRSGHGIGGREKRHLDSPCRPGLP